MRGDRKAGGRQDHGRASPGGAELNALAERITTARSALFVPGDRPDRFDKAIGSGADLVILDLEDAVAADAKDAARTAVKEFLTSGIGVVVRINGADTRWFDEDLAALAGLQCAVMVPKAHSVAQMEAVAARLASATPLVALIETAQGVNAAAAICGADAVVRASFGSIDLATELGVDPDSHEALIFARSALVLASAATGCPAPLDGVTTDLHEGGRLAGDIAHAVRLGYGGKLCIHPRQVDDVNELFSPSADELRWARSILESSSDGGARVVDGKMVDKPVVDRATRVLARARN